MIILFLHWRSFFSLFHFIFVIYWDNFCAFKIFSFSYKYLLMYRILNSIFCCCCSAVYLYYSVWSKIYPVEIMPVISSSIPKFRINFHLRKPQELKNFIEKKQINWKVWVQHRWKPNAFLELGRLFSRILCVIWRYLNKNKSACTNHTFLYICIFLFYIYIYM